MSATPTEETPLKELVRKVLILGPHQPDLVLPSIAMKSMR